jgi:hypothetical protein
MENRTVLMYIAYAETDNANDGGEGAKYKWVDKSEVEKMDINEFTEFYNKDLILDFFEGNYKLIPISILDTREYYKMEDNTDYKRWFKSG